MNFFYTNEGGNKVEMQDIFPLIIGICLKKISKYLIC